MKKTNWKKFIGQLFLWPFIIVVGINLLFYLFGYFKYREFGIFIILTIIASFFTLRFFLTKLNDTGSDFVMECKSLDEIASDEIKFQKQSTDNDVKPNFKRYKLLSPIFRLIAIVISILLIILVVYLIPFKAIGEFILLHNIGFSFVFIICLTQFTLRRTTLEKQTWKKIIEIWLKWSGISALAVGGFGFLANNDTISGKLLTITNSLPFVDIRLMTTIYFVVLVTGFFATVLTAIGRAKADLDDSSNPKYWFVPAFILSWLSFNGLVSLGFCSIFLTFHAHVFYS